MSVVSQVRQPPAIGAGGGADKGQVASSASSRPPVTTSTPAVAGLRLRKPHRRFLGWRGSLLRANVYARTPAGVELAAVQDVRENRALL